jgi:DsbC/DsbD-like thiol-disulfide interchange protein
MRTMASAVLLAAVTLTVPVLASADAAPGRIRVETPALRLAPGELVEIWVEVRVDPSLQVMANPASGDWLVPLELRWDVPEGWEIGPVSYPVGLPHTVEGTEETLLTYEGTVLLCVPIRATTCPRPGPFVLRGELSYQGCTRHACLIPDAVPVQLRGEIRPTEPVEAGGLAGFQPRV